MAARYGQRRKQPYTAEKRLRQALAELEGRIGTRSDGRQHDTGLLKPYRPVPADFEQVYATMGWDGIEDHYGTNWRVIRRWVVLTGRDRLAKIRAAYVERQRQERRRTRRVG